VYTALDISADLQELSRTPVTVVSAGIKSVLDIQRTLEYLETAGVPVFTYKSDNFPAFFSGLSTFKSPGRIDDVMSVANVMKNHKNLGISSGILFAVPAPMGEVDFDRINSAIKQAVEEAELNGMNQGGQDVTPWLLQRVQEITGGRSVQCNIDLLHNCAAVAAELAHHSVLLAQPEASQDTFTAYGSGKSLHAYV